MLREELRRFTKLSAALYGKRAAHGPRGKLGCSRQSAHRTGVTTVTFLQAKDPLGLGAGTSLFDEDLSLRTLRGGLEKVVLMGTKPVSL